jgi:HMG (high mobility group) box
MKSPSILAVTAHLSLRCPGKKAKLPQPPNVFILYRQEHRFLLNAKDPDMHSNDISVIHGKQWKSGLVSAGQGQVSSSH